MVSRFNRGIDAQIREAEQSLGAGKATSYDDYKRICGIIQGLKSAKDAMGDLARKYLDGDEEQQDG